MPRYRVNHWGEHRRDWERSRGRGLEYIGEPYTGENDYGYEPFHYGRYYGRGYGSAFYGGRRAHRAALLRDVRPFTRRGFGGYGLGYRYPERDRYAW